MSILKKQTIVATVMVLIVSLLVSVSKYPMASAQGSANTCGLNGEPKCYDVTIDRLVVTNNGRVYVATSATESQLNANGICAPLGGAFLVLEKTLVGRERVLALLLTAHERRRPLKEIRVLPPNAAGACEIFYVKSEM